ncbi:tubby C-terminal-like domain-containing protein [Aspergillus floccosus]
MSGSSRRSSLSGLFSRPVRMALKPPDRPLALRQESITESKTTLVIKPLGDAQAEVAYAISDADDFPQFTVTGRRFSDRACRDASGLPLFEIHRRLALKNVWAITLPGSDATTIATGSPRGFFGAPAFGNFNVTFENVAAFDAKRVEDRTVTLEIHRYGNVLASFDVVDGDRKVAEVRESIVHNQKLALRASSKNHSHRPALDVIITRGVDTALVSAIAVIAADWVFSTG